MTIELEIKNSCWKELMLYAQEVDSEISGFGRVKMKKDALPKMVELILLKQVCSSASTLIDDQDLASYLEKDKDRKTLKVWWHSHNDMSCFWSPTDETTIAKLLHWTNYIFSIVINNKREYKARLDLQYPFGLNMLMNDIDVDLRINEPVDKKLLQKVRKLIAEKVSEKTFRDYSYFPDTYQQGRIYDPKTRTMIDKADVSLSKDKKTTGTKHKNLVDKFYNYNSHIEVCYSCSNRDCANCEIWDNYCYNSGEVKT